MLCWIRRKKYFPYNLFGGESCSVVIGLYAWASYIPIQRFFYYFVLKIFQRSFIWHYTKNEVFHNGFLGHIYWRNPQWKPSFFCAVSEIFPWFCFQVHRSIASVHTRIFAITMCNIIIYVSRWWEKHLLTRSIINSFMTEAVII